MLLLRVTISYLRSVIVFFFTDFIYILINFWFTLAIYFLILFLKILQLSLSVASWLQSYFVLCFKLLKVQLAHLRLFLLSHCTVLCSPAHIRHVFSNVHTIFINTDYNHFIFTLYCYSFRVYVSVF